MTTPSRMEIWSFFWLLGVAIMGATAVRFFIGGHIAAAVASVIAAITFLLVALLLLRHRLRRTIH